MTRGTHQPAVAVVGGGITGLVAAHRLLSDPQPPRVVVYESASELGGKIRSAHLGGCDIELGPDGFVGRNSPLLPLCHDLGLGDDVVAARAGAVEVWSRGHLRRLPAGLIMGMPVRLGPVLRSRLLSPRELLRAGFDFVLPPTRCDTDLSIAALIGGRMGRGVVDRLVDPLLGGVYAGSVDFLGADAALPGLRERLSGRRSLIRVLRQMGARPATAQLVTVRGGLGRLVDALAADVRRRGGQVHTGTAVATLAAVPDGWQITTRSGQIESVDAVVLAAPAGAAAELLRSSQRGIATDLGLIPYAAVTVASFVYPRNAFAQPPAGNGILVPRIEGTLLRACTWVTSKWPHQARDDVVIARCSTGSYGDNRHADLSDEALGRALHRELSAAAGLRGEPLHTRVTRWHDALPQYRVGHRVNVAAWRARLPATLTLAGAAYDGVGLTACATRGRDAAEQILAHLSEKTTSMPIAGRT